MNTERAISQLKELSKLVDGKAARLAAEGWDENWKTLIATILSSQTRDTKTIEVSKILFNKFNSLKRLSKASLRDIQGIIKPLNYYKTKSKNIKKTAKIIVEKYNSKIPNKFEELLEFPGVGRKVANVYLVASENAACIGVDTHVSRLSRKLGWTKNTDRHKIEKDLENLFPKKYWNSINWILVRFGQTFGRSRKNEDKILKEI